MLASENTAPELALPTLPALELRAVARRVLPVALLAAAAAAVVLALGGPAHEFVASLRRGLGLSPAWVVLTVVLEATSIGAYVVVLSLVAGRATPRIAARESAQITLAGAAATRLLPTAGAGGAAVTVWSLRRAGLGSGAAVRTMLAFMVVLYSVFLSSIAVCGVALTLAGRHGPVALSAIPAVAAVAAIALGLALAWRRVHEPRSRLQHVAQLLADAVRDALSLLRSGELRLAGAAGYWLLDAGAVWAMLHAFGARPSLLVVVLAYFVGQVANTLPIPGSVSGGIAGVLIAFSVPATLALPAVLAYRAIAVWLPSPIGIVAVTRLRATVARWDREDALARSRAQTPARSCEGALARS